MAHQPSARTYESKAFSHSSDGCNSESRRGSPMKTEVLYFDGCPSWQTGVENLKTTLQLKNLS